MTPGDIVLVSMPKRNGKTKKRPALILQRMRPFDDFLVCGISSQLQLEVKGFDLILESSDEDFKATGLKKDSIVRLGYITTVSKTIVPGKIGKISSQQFKILINRLVDYLEEEKKY